MSLGTSIVCVTEGRHPGLVAALRADMRYSVIELTPAIASARIAATRPAAIIVAEPDVAPELIDALCRQVEEFDGPYVPVLAYSVENRPSRSVLPIAPDAPLAHVIARLTSALRVSILHATLQRRAAERATGVTLSDGGREGADAPTVLVAGRGGGYPALTLAVRERAGLIGALSLETARRYLDARDIDGIVIGDGFSARAVATFLHSLRAQLRFRDLPIVVADSRIGVVDFDLLPNADRVGGGVDRVLAHLLPLVRLHAFAARLRRLARSLESKGFVDAETGLLTCDAFVRDLTRAIEDCDKRMAHLSLARFSFERIDRHTGLDAARIVGRLVRTTDFACQDDDGSVHVVFGDTDLKAAHVVARRIASILKHTMLVPDPDAPRLSPRVALVTRRASDSAESLLARVHPAAIAAE